MANPTPSTRPKPEDTDEVNLTVSIPRILGAELERAAKERLVSKSVLAAFLLQDGLQRLIPVSELLRTTPTTPDPTPPPAERVGPPPAAKGDG